MSALAGDQKAKQYCKRQTKTTEKKYINFVTLRDWFIWPK